MTVKEQQEWKIPPCISNWKNAKVSLSLHQLLIFLLLVKKYWQWIQLLLSQISHCCFSGLYHSAGQAFGCWRTRTSNRPHQWELCQAGWGFVYCRQKGIAPSLNTLNPTLLSLLTYRKLRNLQDSVNITEQFLRPKWCLQHYVGVPLSLRDICKRIVIWLLWYIWRLINLLFYILPGGSAHFFTM